MSITPRFNGPHLLVRGQDNRIFIRTYQDGSFVDPASGTVTVFDQDNNKVVDGATVTITTGSIVYYDITAATLPSTLSYASGWRVEWDLVFGASDTDSGAQETLHFINDGSLVRTKVHPVISEADLEKMHSDIDSLLPSDQTSWQDQLDAAFDYIRRKLLKDGRRPELIISSWALADAHLFLTLSYIHRDLATFTSGTGKYVELANQYRDMFESEWDNLVFEYDQNEDGLADDEMETATSTISMHAGPTHHNWYRKY